MLWVIRVSKIFVTYEIERFSTLEVRVSMSISTSWSFKISMQLVMLQSNVPLYHRFLVLHYLCDRCSICLLFLTASTVHMQIPRSSQAPLIGDHQHKNDTHSHSIVMQRFCWFISNTLHIRIVVRVRTTRDQMKQWTVNWTRDIDCCDTSIVGCWMFRWHLIHLFMQ